MRATPKALERLSLTVPDAALETYEAALESTCETVGFFQNHTTGAWTIEGVRELGADPAPLAAALALAETLTGVPATLNREPIDPEGWLERSYAAFPEQLIGRRFAVRGSHIDDLPKLGRITLRLDAGLAFGSGEHGSTRGCLIALERLAYHKPRRILDLGTGSGILAMAAAALLHRPVLATDIEPWSVRLARRNAQTNGLAGLIQARLADGWDDPVIRRHSPYDLVLANILARPLSLMAKDLAPRLAPGGVVILSGLLHGQANSVLAAHRRHGLKLRFRVGQGDWTTLVLGK